MTSMPDVQSTPDVRNIPINQVGIKDLRFPVRIRSQSGEQASPFPFSAKKPRPFQAASR